MYYEHINQVSENEREVWHFSLGVNSANSYIWCDGYSVQSRASTRHKWIVNSSAKWINGGVNNSLLHPPLPDYAVNAARKHFADQISNLEVKL